MNDHEIKTHSLTAGHLNVRPKRKGKTSIYKWPILGFHVFLGEVFVFFCEGIKLHANVWSVWGICPRNHVWLGVTEWPLMKCVHDGSNFIPTVHEVFLLIFPSPYGIGAVLIFFWHMVVKMVAISFSMSMGWELWTELPREKLNILVAVDFVHVKKRISRSVRWTSSNISGKSLLCRSTYFRSFLPRNTGFVCGSIEGFPPFQPIYPTNIKITDKKNKTF